MCAVPNIAVFCGSLTSYSPGMLLMYFLNDFEIVPVASLITGITFVFTLLLLLLLLLYDMDVSCHMPFLPGTSLVPAVIPTAQASGFTLQYFPYYV